MRRAQVTAFLACRWPMGREEHTRPQHEWRRVRLGSATPRGSWDILVLCERARRPRTRSWRAVARVSGGRRCGHTPGGNCLDYFLRQAFAETTDARRRKMGRRKKMERAEVERESHQQQNEYKMNCSEFVTSLVPISKPINSCYSRFNLRLVYSHLPDLTTSLPAS